MTKLWFGRNFWVTTDVAKAAEAGF